jgi:hypothetical protein
VKGTQRVRRRPPLGTRCMIASRPISATSDGGQAASSTFWRMLVLSHSVLVEIESLRLLIFTLSSSESTQHGRCVRAISRHRHSNSATALRTGAHTRQRTRARAHLETLTNDILDVVDVRRVERRHHAVGRHAHVRGKLVVGERERGEHLERR